MATLKTKRKKKHDPTVDRMWKGENECEPEYVEGLESFPLDNAGIWSVNEANILYRQKLEHLRNLYMGQLSRLSTLLQERKRQFLLEWQAAGGSRDKADLPSEGGSKHDVAYRCFRKRMGEHGLLERRLKLRRVSATLDLYSKKELRESNKTHYQHLVKMQQSLRPNNMCACSTAGCSQISMPFTTKCSKHILEDSKQLLYTQCTHTNTGGIACTNPVPKYLRPLLCGDHWYQASLNVSKYEETDSESDEETAPSTAANKTSNSMTVVKDS